MTMCGADMHAKMHPLKKNLVDAKKIIIFFIFRKSRNGILFKQSTLELPRRPREEREHAQSTYNPVSLYDGLVLTDCIPSLCMAVENVVIVEELGAIVKLNCP